MEDIEGIDAANVISWEGRPQRAKRPRQLTYWEEYVETDKWYLKKLLEDVPPEEMHAAIHDEDFDMDEEEDEEGEEEEEEEEEEEDAEYVGEVSESSAEEDDEAESSPPDSPRSVIPQTQIFRTPERQ